MAMSNTIMKAVATAYAKKRVTTTTNHVALMGVSPSGWKAAELSRMANANHAHSVAMSALPRNMMISLSTLMAAIVNMLLMMILNTTAPDWHMPVPFSAA